MLHAQANLHPCRNSIHNKTSADIFYCFNKVIICAYIIFCRHQGGSKLSFEALRQLCSMRVCLRVFSSMRIHW